MRMLVTGGSGQVGRALVEGAQAPQQIVAPPRAVLDLTKPATIAAALDRRPDIVVNAAAYTAVDKAEDEPEAAFAANRDGVAELARQCAARNIPLIHLSTDYVFDGTKRGGYVETDTTNPLSVYGDSKQQGEAALRAAHTQHVILRCSWVFGSHGTNFVRAILTRAANGGGLRVVDDQRGCPTPVSAIAGAISRVAKRIGSGADVPWGTFHYAGREPVTWFEFAKAILAYAQPWLPTVPAIEPIPTSGYPTRARRPANSVLDCGLIASRYGITPDSWKGPLADAVAGMRATILDSVRASRVR